MTNLCLIMMCSIAACGAVTPEAQPAGGTSLVQTAWADQDLMRQMIRKQDRRVSKKVTFEADLNDQDVQEFCADMVQLGATVASHGKSPEPNGTTVLRYAVFEATEQQMRNIMVQDGVADVSDVSEEQMSAMNATNTSQAWSMRR